MKFNVTYDDMNHGELCDCRSCAVVMSICRTLELCDPDDLQEVRRSPVEATPNEIYIRGTYYETPGHVGDFMNAYDEAVDNWPDEIEFDLPVDVRRV